MQPVQSPSFIIRRIEAEINGESSRPEKNSCFTIIWVTTGICTCRNDLERHEIKEDMIYTVSRGNMFLLEFSENCSGYVLSFTSEFLYQLSGHSGRSLYEEKTAIVSGACTIEKREEAEEMRIIVSYLQREYEKYSLLRPAILSGWLKIFLVYVNGLSRIPMQCLSSSKVPELVNIFYSMVEKNFPEKRMVSDYASEMAISANYLNQIVKRVSGYSASHHIQQRVILEAKRLALYSNASMKEIAYQLGFEEPPHFSKFFKNFAGTNFKEFKKRNITYTESYS